MGVMAQDDGSRVRLPVYGGAAVSEPASADVDVEAELRHWEEAERERLEAETARLEMEKRREEARLAGMEAERAMRDASKQRENYTLDEAESAASLKHAPIKVTRSAELAPAASATPARSGCMGCGAGIVLFVLAGAAATVGYWV